MYTTRFVALGALLLSASVSAAECDFSGAATGMCKASITIQNEVNSNGSSSADILIKSSAECSKVSYRNGTLLETSLVRSGTSRESLSSSTPIDQSDIAVTSCQSFSPPSSAAPTAPTAATAADPVDKPPEPKDGTLTGRWNSNYNVYWDLWEENGKIIGTQVIQLDDTRKPTYSFVTTTRKGKTVTLNFTTPILEKIGSNDNHPQTYRIVSADIIKNRAGNVTMTRQKEKDVDRAVRSVAGHWTNRAGDVTYNLIDENGVISGTGSSTGDWPEVVGNPKFDAKVDLVIEGSRKGNEITLSVRDKSGKVTSTRYGMRNDHTFWKDGSIAMIRG